ncbi:MAG: hypothetical protein J0H43_15890, partial [Actinobacteria bacterium]|nr:hypothetical protein [Actinomycetota bacterium]
MADAISTKTGAEVERAATRRPLRWRRELLLAAVLYAVYDAVRGQISASTARADHDGALLLRWEQSLHLDPEHALNALVTHTTWLAVP